MQLDFLKDQETIENIAKNPDKWEIRTMTAVLKINEGYKNEIERLRGIIDGTEDERILKEITGE